MSQASPNKTVLRAALRDRRRALSPALRIAAAQRAAALFLADVDIPSDAYIAGYYPLADELSPLTLLQALRGKGHSIALPVTAPKGQPLSFRLWDDTVPLVKSAFGVQEPAAGDTVIPEVLIVPLLGFDSACHRLGYGAGHYDRTMADLRGQGKTILTVGFAFQCQYVATPLPTEAHDIALDCVVTEDRLYWPPSENVI